MLLKEGSKTWNWEAKPSNSNPLHWISTVIHQAVGLPDGVITLQITIVKQLARCQDAWNLEEARK